MYVLPGAELQPHGCDMTTTEADSLHLQLCRALSANRLVSWTIGEIGSQMKAAKNYLKLHDSPSWKSYCAEIGIPYSTFSNYVRIYGRYGPDGLNIGQTQYMRIGPRKLLDLVPVMHGYGQEHVEVEHWSGPNRPISVDEWLIMGESLSESDLRIIINEHLGRENKKHGGTIEAAGDMGDTPPTPMTPTTYKKLVKAAPCCVCNSIATEHTQIHSHHFPQTRNRTDADHKVIPLCMTCHQECHQDPKEFLWLYKSNIFDWFYRKIVQ